MSKRVSRAVSAILIATAFTAFAQGEATTPSMSPEQNGSPQSPKPASNSLQKERPKGAKTEITAQKEATFDNAANRAVFVGKVVVKDPQFTLFCNRLVVLLNKDRKGMDRAEAYEDVVIIQENKNEKGNDVKSTGRSGKAVFEPSTGDITLTESPQIQQGINNHVGDPATIMVLNREGRLNTQGPSRTVIVDASEGDLH